MNTDNFRLSTDYGSMGRIDKTTQSIALPAGVVINPVYESHNLITLPNNTTDSGYRLLVRHSKGDRYVMGGRFYWMDTGSGSIPYNGSLVVRALNNNQLDLAVYYFNTSSPGSMTSNASPGTLDVIIEQIVVR